MQTNKQELPKYPYFDFETYSVISQDFSRKNLTSYSYDEACKQFGKKFVDGLMEEEKINNEKITFSRDVDLETEATAFIKSLAPIVTEGFPTCSPYHQDKDYSHDVDSYLSFRALITKEGEASEKFSSGYEALDAFKKAVLAYIGKGKKRVIVRSWPRIEKVDNLTREKPFWKIKCRLIADDGTRELRPLLTTNQGEVK